MSAAVSSHSGAGPLSLMSCVRESSPPQDGGPEYETEKNVSSKKKFWNPRKWFKRKSNKVSEEVISTNDAEPKENGRSRSTSELSIAEEQTRRRSGTPMHPGLSVSHDSVFHSPHSGSELELDAAQSSSSLSISNQPIQLAIRLQTELSERLKLKRIRGDTSEDDEGLPHSPCNSPTTTEGLLDKSNIKDHPTKSHSTCSDGSLLSMGSSEMDEDSFGQHSRHSSKLSLHDQRASAPSDVEEVWGPSNSSAPLNHSAAHHKVAVRPKRTHGAPRRRRVPVPVSALPTTPEVNEDSSIRSLTPDSAIRETVTELYTSMSQQTQTISDSKIKCSSLPPGLAGPGADGSKLSRSRSNAGIKSPDTLEEEETESKKDVSFFGRIFPRRSGKKKKSREEKKEEKTVVNITTTSFKTEAFTSVNINYEPFDRNTIAVDSNLAIRPNALKSGPGSRQRMQPIDIPPSPDINRHNDLNVSPLNIELETHFKNRMTVASSPPKTLQNSPPSSPLQFSMSPPKSPWIEKRQYTKYSKFPENSDSKSKVRIAGLSSLQQRVLSLNDDTDNSFKSLTNLPTDYEKPIRPIAKSHSFKSAKTYEHKDNRYTYSAAINDFKTELTDKTIFKSMSLDSVTNTEEKIDECINQAKVNESTFKTSDESNGSPTFEDNITISGPSHKAIVNIGSMESHIVVTNNSDEVTIKEQQISVTKIQVKRESSQITMTKNSATEFCNLNKIDVNPVVILNSQQDDNQNEIVTIDKHRKFSNDNIEVIKKEDSEAAPKSGLLVTVTPMTNNRYRKHSESMKRGCEKPMLRVKSNSFEATETKRSVESSPSKEETKSQENISENIVLRRKSLIRHKQDDEPELMKVFARRSLKLKDSDSEALSQQVILMVQESEAQNKARESDKENLSDSSPLEERKKPVIKEKQKPKDIKVFKEPLSETTEVTLRKPITNNKFLYQRAVSMNPPPKTEKVLKQHSLVERPKTDTWFNKNHDEDKEVLDTDEIITNLAEKSDIMSDFNGKPNNFTQRKAEWEKRAQEALRKTTP